MQRRKGIAGESRMPKLPAFASEQEVADWFATHDTADYMDDLEEVKERIPVRRTRFAEKPIGLLLRADQLEAIKKVAKRKDIPFETLIRSWLLEKLRQEAPDLLQEHR
jgi:predicted DNA binding CopG/RHH family protein